MHSKFENKISSEINDFIKIFFILSLIFNNIMFQIKYENNFSRNSNCYYFGNIFNLNIPKRYICNNINALTTNFYYYNENLINNIDLLVINTQNTILDDIFLFIGIFPFLNNNSIIYYKINNKHSYKFFKDKLKYNIGNQLISLNYNNYTNFINDFENIISYNWEIFPKKSVINNIRYILNNYYNDSFIDIFDNSLNYNFKNYLNKTFSKLSFDDINNLMSKHIYLYL